jgi:hypothetical protein
VVGLALLAFYERSRLPGPRPALGPAAWSLVALAIAGTLFVAWRPAQTARAYFARQQSFPILASYGDHVALPMVSTANAAATVEALPEEWRRRSGEGALRVHYEQGSSSNAWPIRYVGIELSPDWRGYSTLALDLANPGSVALPLSLRIRDAGHHWEFDPPPALSFKLPAATRATYRFELGRIATRDGRRPLDIARIEEIFLMPAEPDVAADLFLARVWLER